MKRRYLGKGRSMGLYIKGLKPPTHGGFIELRVHVMEDGTIVADDMYDGAIFERHECVELDIDDKEFRLLDSLKQYIKYLKEG